LCCLSFCPLSFWLLCCLSFVDSRLLITPLASSNYSFFKLYKPVSKASGLISSSAGCLIFHLVSGRSQ
jgi:hypothetical protein